MSSFSLSNAGLILFCIYYCYVCLFFLGSFMYVCLFVFVNFTCDKYSQELEPYVVQQQYRKPRKRKRKRKREMFIHVFKKEKKKKKEKENKFTFASPFIASIAIVSFGSSIELNRAKNRLLLKMIK